MGRRAARFAVAVVVFVSPVVVGRPAAAQVGENIALDKPATQSSTLGSFTAGLAVDGQRGNFSHTSPNADLPGPAWWQVDLGEVFDIGAVIVWNRTSCCGSRLRDIIVQILAEDGETVAFQTTDPADPDPAALLNPENVLGTFPNGPASLTVTTGAEPVPGRFVRVLRLPDEDLSGTGGQGTSLEATVLSIAEVEVFASSGCPDEGDTHCEGLDIAGPPGETVGAWSVTAFASDESGDPITYTFVATHESGATVRRVESVDFTTLALALPGEWTVTVAVDDDALCPDAAADAVCEDAIDVLPREGLTDGEGLILTRGFLVLGPFSHPFGCGPAAESGILRNHIAPARIECEYPAEGDPVEYDPALAASLAYLGPDADGAPIWRALDDGTPENGDQDLNGDIGPRDDVMSWLVTYVEYTGAIPVEIEICLGSDDGGQVWFDDRRVISDGACRGRGNCDVRSAPITVEPGVHRIAAAAWNRGGGWGLRLSLQDLTLGPIVDDDTIFPDWRFHGRTPPPGFEPPECAGGGCRPEPVRDLTCAVAGGQLVLEWTNPPVTDPATPTRIEVDDGFDFTEVATVPSDATGIVLSAADLPPSFTRIAVIHCGGVPATCSPFKTDTEGNLITESFLVLGPFTHRFRCNGPARNLLRNSIAPSDVTCLYPEAGDEIPYDPAGPDAATTGYVGPTGPGGMPIVRRFDDGTPGDGDQDLNGDLGQMNDVMSWLFTYVEYAGDDPVTLTICFGSGDGGQLRVNDEVLITNPKCRTRDDCQDEATIELDGPALLRIAAAAWNSGGRWGLRLRLLAGGTPIVDSPVNEEWIFHGPSRPEGVFPCPAVAFLRGDSNDDGTHNLSDPIRTLGFLFLGEPQPSCLAAADSNADGTVSISDPTYSLNFLFTGGPPPPAPFPACGTAADPGPGCDAAGACQG